MAWNGWMVLSCPSLHLGSVELAKAGKQDSKRSQGHWLSDLSPDFIKAMRDMIERELIDLPPEFEATLLDIDKAEKRSSARRSGVGKKVEALP